MDLGDRPGRRAIGPRLACLLAGWLLAAQGAQAQTEQKVYAFELRPREADAIVVEINKAGGLVAEAAWRGGPGELTLSISEAGADQPLATRTGPSPVRIELALTDQQVEDSASWSVRVAGAVEGRVAGSLTVRWPQGPRKPDVVRVHGASQAINGATSRSFFSQIVETENPKIPALVRLLGSPTQVDRQRLADQGLEILDRVADNTYQAAVTRGRLFARDPAGATDPLVAGIASLKPGLKIQRNIELGQFSRFVAPGQRTGAEDEASSYVLNPDGTVNLTVHFLKGVAATEMQRTLGLYAGKAAKFTDNAWVVTMPPQAIRRLAGEPTVVWIEASPPPLKAENDVTRATIGVDAAQGVRAGHLPPEYRLSGGGDLDALVGAADGTVWAVTNRGGPAAAAFADPRALTVGPGPIDVGGRAVPILIDLDGDGPLDLVVGDAEGRITLFMNRGSDLTPGYVAGSPLIAGGSPLDVGSNAAPCAWDVDHDGDLDILVGNGAGQLLLVLNTGGPRSLGFAAPSLRGSGSESVVGGNARPALEDIDDDGDLDLLVGSGDGRILLFSNSGTLDAPSLEPGVPLQAGGAAIDVGGDSSPVFGDLDGDGARDLIVTNAAGVATCFKSSGTGGARSFGAGSPLALPALVGASAIAGVALQDLDLDGVRVVNGEACQADSRHGDFTGRIVFARWTDGICREPDHVVHDVDHATHVVGIMGASGARSDLGDADGVSNAGGPYQWRGMAPRTGLVLLNNMKDAEHYFLGIEAHGAHLINGSYSVSAGSEYNGLNQLGDQVVRGDATHEGRAIAATALLFSSGNSGGDGYFSLTKQHKNALVVGNWDTTALPPRVRAQSSLGPTTDGRVKPDVVVNGTEIISTLSTRLDGYGPETGTSMSSPGAAGALGLVLDSWARTYRVSLGEARPLPSTLRGLVIHTARDIDWVNAPPAGVSNGTYTNADGPIAFFPGPDFASGWGLLDASAAVAAVGRKEIAEGSLARTGDEWAVEFDAPTMPVKVTLAWDDPAASPSTDAATTPLLVNDIDLELIGPDGVIHYPFSPNQRIVAVDDPSRELTPEEQTPGKPLRVEARIKAEQSGLLVRHPVDLAGLAAAPTGRDHLNNVEQVVATGPPGRWRARARAFNIQVGPQRLSLLAPLGPDTTPPVLRGPATIRVQAPGADGLPSAALLPSACGISTSDDRDSAPGVVVVSPPRLPVGTTSVIFRATDSAANAADLAVRVVVTAAATGLGLAEAEGAAAAGPSRRLLDQLIRQARSPGGAGRTSDELKTLLRIEQD